MTIEWFVNVSSEKGLLWSVVIYKWEFCKWIIQIVLLSFVLKLVTNWYLKIYRT